MLSKIFFLGPLIGGHEDFDQHSLFGNDVEMTGDQVAYLRDQVAIHKPSIPYYVCKMTKSNVITGKAKMVSI